MGTLWILNSPQRQAAELDSLLGQEKERFQVLPGRDKMLYVAAQNERDTLWARQVLARGDYDKNARVINENEENKRISTGWIPIILSWLIIGFISMSRVNPFSG